MAESPDQTAAPDSTTLSGSVYADDLFCPECGYSLRGLTSKRCPECGLQLDFIESEVSLIPWERRREIGRTRAYWRTVVLAMFRNEVLCRAAYQPVTYGDAQLFRWVTLLHVFVPLLLVLPLWAATSPHTLEDVVDEVGWWFVGLVCVCVLLGLMALTGLPSYFFHPRHMSTELQNRAVALSYYGCSSLALMPLPFIAFSVAMFAIRLDSRFAALTGLMSLVALMLGLIALLVPRPFSWRSCVHPKTVLVVVPLTIFALCAGGIWMGERPRAAARFLGVSSAVAPLGLVLLYWFDLIAIARRTLRRPGPVWRLVCLLPVLWLICVGLIVVVSPAAAYLVALAFYSLRTGGLGG
jgi:hypothetical protein